MGPDKGAGPGRAASLGRAVGPGRIMGARRMGLCPLVPVRGPWLVQVVMPEPVATGRVMVLGCNGPGALAKNVGMVKASVPGRGHGLAAMTLRASLCP